MADFKISPLWTGIGVGLGVAADVAFYALGQPGNNLPIEHGHVGVGSLILAAHHDDKRVRSAATGFGTALIIEDAANKDNFGATSPDGTFTIGFYAVEIGILIMELAKKKGA